MPEKKFNLLTELLRADGNAAKIQKVLRRFHRSVVQPERDASYLRGRQDGLVEGREALARDIRSLIGIYDQEE